jgi:hypothetical protein
VRRAWISCILPGPVASNRGKRTTIGCTVPRC